jgi:UDP-glucose 4-epimerase
VSRVLVTGGAGTIGAAVVRRLLGDPAYEVRVADRRAAPLWMREGCEVHTVDLRELAQARKAAKDCTHVVHLAAITGGVARRERIPHTLAEANDALQGSILRAALEVDVERFVHVSSPAVFERAELFPTPESYLRECPVPSSAYGFSKLAGELYCRRAADEHGLPYSICRPGDAYGPGEPAGEQPGIAHVIPDLIDKVLSGQAPLEIFGSGAQTRTFTHVEDIAEGIVTAMGSAAALNEDFNLASAHELTIAEVARRIWTACGEDADAFALKHLPTLAGEIERSWPDVEKARELLGWQARIALDDGISATVRWLREHAPAHDAEARGGISGRT